MARVKICPKCGAENSPSSAFCFNENCGWDLSNVKSVNKGAAARQGEAAKPAPAVVPQEEAPENVGADKESLPPSVPEAATSEPAEDAPREENAVPPGKVWAKICPKCGQANRVVAKQCVACHENLKFFTEKTLVDRSQLQGSSGASSPEPAAAPKPENEVIASLNDPDGKTILKIDTLHPITVIGREHAMADYLAPRDYTSRLHAELQVMGKRLSLVDKGRNGTYINDVKMSPGSTEVLKPGDRVSMGDRWPDDWKKSLAGCFVVAYETGE